MISPFGTPGWGIESGPSVIVVAGQHGPDEEQRERDAIASSPGGFHSESSIASRDHPQLLRAELPAHRAHVLVHLFGPPRTDDRGRYAGLRERPGDSELTDGLAVPIGDGAQPLHKRQVAGNCGSWKYGLRRRQSSSATRSIEKLPDSSPACIGL